MNAVINTTTGRVRGAAADDGVIAWRAIPFAAAPVGQLRYAPPQPHPGWSEIRDAIHAGPAVPQWPSRLEAVMGTRIPDWSEDGCLTVNVWAPQRDIDRPRPVLLWFHGGGFSSGSGGWDWYDGARLAALGDIVVVTANYRLGALGYLRLPDVDNLGSQDQVAALRWVADNIGAFGGDPELVTVGGQSAGAFSAMALAMDPATSGLVRRVIGQSGPWGIRPQDPDEAAAVSAKYLDLLGISMDADPLSQLRDRPVVELVSVYARLMTESARPGWITPSLYPVLGGAGHPALWQEAVPAGALAGKEILLGSTDNELAAFYGLNPMIRGIGRDEAVRMLDVMAEGTGDARYRPCAAPHPQATPAQVLTSAASEVYFGDGMTEIAGEHAAQGNSAYVYRFTRRPAPDPFGLGAVHCAELPFLFGTLDSYPNSPMLGAVNDADRALADAFGGALAAFVATGSPNGPGLEVWDPWKSGAGLTVREF